MAGYLKTAARKAAIKRWQAAGSAARRRRKTLKSATSGQARLRRNVSYKLSVRGLK